MIRMALLFNDV